MKLIFIFIVSLSLFACATTPSVRAKNIREADQERVSNCKLLGTVTGHSSWGGWTSAGLKDSAVAEALNKAAELEATDIVWTNQVQANSGGQAFGRAYRCD